MGQLLFLVRRGTVTLSNQYYTPKFENLRGNQISVGVSENIETLQEGSLKWQNVNFYFELSTCSQ